MNLKFIVMHILNACAKAMVLSFLVAKTIEGFGVTDLFWTVLLTIPLSFALYNWYGLVVMDIEPKEPEEPGEGKQS